jgi:hypothetical protein
MYEKKLFDNFRLDCFIIAEKNYVCIKLVDLKLLIGGWVDLKLVYWIAHSNHQDRLRLVSKITVRVIVIGLGQGS